MGVKINNMNKEVIEKFIANRKQKLEGMREMKQQHLNNANAVAVADSYIVDLEYTISVLEESLA